MACNNCNNCGNDININIATNRYGYNNGYFFDYYGANLCNQCCSTNTCSDCNTECSTPEILECPYGMQNTSCSVYNGTEYGTPVITTGMDLNTVLENIVDLLVSAVSPFDCTDLEDCSIDSLGDVDTTGVAEGDILTWDSVGSNWIPETTLKTYIKKYEVSATGDISVAQFATDLATGVELIATPGAGKLIQVLSIKKIQNAAFTGAIICYFRLGAGPSYMGTDWISCTSTDLYKNIAIHQSIAPASGIHSNVNTALTIDNNSLTTTNPGTVTSLIYYITYNIINI